MKLLARRAFAGQPGVAAPSGYPGDNRNKTVNPNGVSWQNAPPIQPLRGSEIISSSPTQGSCNPFGIRGAVKFRTPLSLARARATWRLRTGGAKWQRQILSAMPRDYSDPKHLPQGKLSSRIAGEEPFRNRSENSRDETGRRRGETAGGGCP